MGTTTKIIGVAEKFYYTIPRNKWELQPSVVAFIPNDNYTIPRNKWELQRIV